MFLVGLKRDLTTPKGGVIKWNEIKFDEGGNYNQNTGQCYSVLFTIYTDLARHVRNEVSALPDTRDKLYRV